MFLNPNIFFSNLNSNWSNVLYLSNLQEDVNEETVRFFIAQMSIPGSLQIFAFRFGTKLPKCYVIVYLLFYITKFLSCLSKAELF